MFDVIEDDLSSEKSRDLIAFHRAGMSESVPDDAEFLGLCDLQQPEVTVWSAWQDSRIASIGALKMLPDGPQKSSRCERTLVSWVVALVGFTLEHSLWWRRVIAS